VIDGEEKEAEAEDESEDPPAIGEFEVGRFHHGKC
jgi:hypothetical protein